MKDKIIAFTALAAVLAIGFIGLVNVDSNTGAAMLENRYCRCEYQPVQSANYVGGAFQDMEPISKIIRVRDAMQQENCYTYCGSYAHRGLQLLSAEPAGLGGAPVDIEGYHAPRY
jgi:hypothetical protein